MKPTQATGKILQVHWEKDLVGHLWSTEQSPLIFQYAATWLEKGSRAISLSLPLRKDSFHAEAHSFFGNLLPEGDFRRRIERLFKVSTDNDFSLLDEIGGDCAGALTISSQVKDEDDAYYEDIGNSELLRIIQTEGIAGMGHIGQRNRLSLAGAQGKLPVRFTDGKIQIPHRGAPSTHIIKFNRQSGEYPQLVENEYYMNRIAGYLEMKVISCELLKIDKQTILISKRYDRSHDEWARRYHQEDFCQALNVSHQKKYQKEGGPDFAVCIRLTRDHLSLLEVNQLLTWYLFNVATGNSDAHGKNLSLLYREDGSIHLAPFYDLVCTRAYDRLDRKLAMACGDEYDPDLITPKQLHQMAEQIGVTQRFILQRFRYILQKIPQAMHLAFDDFQKQGFTERHIQHVLQCQRKILQRLARSFK